VRICVIGKFPPIQSGFLAFPGFRGFSKHLQRLILKQRETRRNSGELERLFGSYLVGGAAMRTIRDAKLETRAARARLVARRKPYWKALLPGKVALGFRKKATGEAGKWLVRCYRGGERYHIASLGFSDDFSDMADGSGVLDFATAQQLALGPVDSLGFSNRPKRDSRLLFGRQPWASWIGWS
jgi:hypothetical protein